MCRNPRLELIERDFGDHIKLRVISGNLLSYPTTDYRPLYFAKSCHNSKLFRAVITLGLNIYGITDFPTKTFYTTLYRRARGNPYCISTKIKWITHCAMSFHRIAQLYEDLTIHYHRFQKTVTFAKFSCHGKIGYEKVYDTVMN